MQTLKVVAIFRQLTRSSGTDCARMMELLACRGCVSHPSAALRVSFLHRY